MSEPTTPGAVASAPSTSQPGALQPKSPARTSQPGTPSAGRSEPSAGRPYMPDYGIRTVDGRGMLTWGWAEARIVESQNYWLATVWPDGRPQVTPVWGVWLGGEVWFSCGLRARKLVNLRSEPRCAITTQDPENPVVINGEATVVRDIPAIAAFLAAVTEKYGPTMDMDFLHPDTNATVRVTPRTAFGIRHDDFTESPTRWTFAPSTSSAS